IEQRQLLVIIEAGHGAAMVNRDDHQCADHGKKPQGLQRTAHDISPPLLATCLHTSMRPQCRCCGNRSPPGHIRRRVSMPMDATVLAMRITVYGTSSTHASLRFVSSPAQLGCCRYAEI